MRLLVVTANNSLSHVAQGLALVRALTDAGHEARIAVSRQRAPFVEQVGVQPAVLPDIQESDAATLPTVEWFRKPGTILACIRAELDLIKSWRPDRVVGILRFTTKAAAQAARVPFDALACGCMLADCPDVLGFAPGEPELERQRSYIDGFFRYAGAQTSKALKSLGLGRVRDVRTMLEGERTFLWDVPEFQPLPARKHRSHVGPVTWHDWPREALSLDALRDGPGPLAVVGFGTCPSSGASARRIVGALLDQGFRVLLAAGGQRELRAAAPADPRVTTCGFAPLRELLPVTSLLVCHGGQLTIFDALRAAVPVLVMPLQPEQAHNGVCLERLGCGGRLVPPQPFLGSSRVFVDALARSTDAELGERIERVTRSSRVKQRLAATQTLLAGYQPLETLVSALCR